MTDIEKIKRGLECCGEHTPGLSCGNCPYDGGAFSLCQSHLAYDALALIDDLSSKLANDTCENCSMAVENRKIVMCRDCKHGRAHLCTEYVTCFKEGSGTYGHTKRAEWHCADGERKYG